MIGNNLRRHIQMLRDNMCRKRNLDIKIIKNDSKRYIATMMLIAICFVTFFSGCSEKKESDTNIYYLTASGDDIGYVGYNFKSDDTNKRIQEMMDQLSSDPSTVELKRTIPSSVKLLDYELDNTTLMLYFNRDYGDIGGYKEVLIRAAIVKTLLQLEDVDGISFYVADSPLTDVNGSLVGTMTADTFIEDFSADSEELSKTTLPLYFASADGQSLVKQDVEVYYNTNVSIERLVVEHLLQGPEKNDVSKKLNLIGTMPDETKLKSISVNDGVCYLKFDSNFLNGNSNVSSNVLLYSIVDSLTEIDTINRVQISVETSNNTLESQVKALGFDLNKSYERDLSMVIEAPPVVEKDDVVEE